MGYAFSPQFGHIPISAISACGSFAADHGTTEVRGTDGYHRSRNGPFGRDVVQAPGGASGLSHDETRCAAFAGAGASSASATRRFRESIPHPVQPLSTLRTPRRRDARKTRSRPACSALNGPDFHWQAHSSFPLAPRIRLSDKTSRRFRVRRPRQLLEHHHAAAQFAPVVESRMQEISCPDAQLAKPQKLRASKAGRS